MPLLSVTYRNVSRKKKCGFGMPRAVYTIIQFDEVRMATLKICPFYGKNDDQCDVGCGYISPHDVKMIIQYCNGHHPDCSKYKQLADRFSTEAS